MQITENIKYIGVNDHDITLFESLYPVKNGMSYNSYVILDEKTAVMDTVEASFTDEWLHKLEAVLNGKTPDFLIIQHMEPDHSAGIGKFMEKYPSATLVAGKRAFFMIKQFFQTDYPDRQLVVKEGDCLCLGKHRLTFLEAPMVHWPEVIMTYESTEGILFSADAFGKFGALDKDEPWLAEGRRYYIGIVGKYGIQVSRLLEKALALDIRMICSLHGPLLKGNLTDYLSLYQTWAKYEPEQKGVLIAYASIYGNTEIAAKRLGETLQAMGCQNVVLRDLVKCDITEAVSNAFCYDRLVLAATTYNGGLFPPMLHFVNALMERNYQNRRIGIIENGSWSPTPARCIKGIFEHQKNITYCEPIVTIRSCLSDESNQALMALAENLKEPATT